MAKFTGITGSLLKRQAEARAKLRARQERERRAAKSYGKRGKAAAAARARMAERQAREMAELLKQQQEARELTKTQYTLGKARDKTWEGLKAQYAQGNIPLSGFRAENLRQALLQYHGLQGQDAQDFENTVKRMSLQDLTNLGRMYSNVLETWKDSEGYFNQIAEEVVRKIKGMARQTTRNISRMLAKGESELDDETVRLALNGWSFGLHTTDETLREMGLK